MSSLYQIRAVVMSIMCTLANGWIIAIYCQSELEANGPSSKKQKLNDHNNSSSNTSSICFVNSSDHQHFLELFQVIDGSQLIKSLNITHFISKDIAEFATGSFEKCANTKCMNEIPTLYQDKELYDVHHSNANEKEIFLFRMYG